MPRYQWRKAFTMKVIIIGGGIGGLTAALMLHARGIDCEIFEQSDAIRELGVGINTLPHAIKELADLGLLDAARRGRDPHLRAVLHQPLRPGDLARAARHSTPASKFRNSRSIAAGCRTSSTRRCARGSAKSRIHTGSSPRRLHSGRGRRHRLFLRPRRLASRTPRAATSWSAPTASIRWCAKRSTPMKGRRAGTARCCGAAPPTGRSS